MSKRKNSALLIPAPDAATLLADLRQLIEVGRRSVAVAVNASLMLMYWRIGKHMALSKKPDELIRQELDILRARGGRRRGRKAKEDAA